MKKIVDFLMYSSNLGFILSKWIIKTRNFFFYKLYLSDEKVIKSQFKKAHGYALNLNNPKTLNEKMQWLKLNDRTIQHTIYADKYAVRDVFEKKYGKTGLIELLYHTKDWKEIKEENMPEIPFIIKPNHGSGWYHIVQDKKVVDWNKIQTDCRLWLNLNYYDFEREWQYKDMVPRIIVEKLLIRSDGNIPTNYRVHCFHGKVGLIALTIYFGKETNNYRNLKYSRDWELLNIDWAAKKIDLTQLRNNEGIPRPKSLDQMISLAEDISKDFKYVRVDFYDVDDKLYHGEITFHDGGGYEVITPFDWDVKLGEMINLK